jgi:hypothetical protein
MPTDKVYLTKDVEYIYGAFKSFFGAYNTNTLTDTNINLMRKDPTISLGWGMISEPIKGLSFNWDVDETDEKGKKQKEFAELFITPFIRELRSKALMSLLYGRNSVHKILEKATLDNREVYIPSKYKSFKPENVKIIPDQYYNYAGVEYDNIRYDPRQVAHFVWGGEFVEEALYGVSILNPTYQAFYRYNIVWLLYVRYLEKQAAPTAKVYHPENEIGENGAETDYASVAAGIGESIKSGSTATLFSTRDDNGNLAWDIEYLEANANGEEFVKNMDKAETLMLRSILIPDGAIARPEGAVGTFAESKQRADMFTTRLEIIAQTLDDAITAQIVDQLMVINFDQPIPIRLISEPVVDDDRILLDEMFKSLVSQDARAKEAVVQMFADRFDVDLEEMMELIIAKNEVLTPELPEQPDNPDEQPTGGQQKQKDDIKMERTIEAEILEFEGKPQPRTKDETTTRFLAEAGKAVEKAKTDFNAGRSLYQEALARHITASWKMGAEKGYSQMTGKVKFNRVPVDTSWIKKRVRNVSGKQWDNLKWDGEYIKLSGRQASDTKYVLNFDLFAAGLETTAITEFQEAVNRGFAAAMEGIVK